MSLAKHVNVEALMRESHDKKSIHHLMQRDGAKEDAFTLSGSYAGRYVRAFTAFPLVITPADTSL
jgi:hypothetical protein